MTYGDLGGLSGGGTTNRQAAEAVNEAAAAKREVAELQDQLARLKFVCAAVWEIVRERTKLTEDDLAIKVAEIDARDGIADGRLTRPTRKCVQCGRTVSSKQTKCMYCGLVQPVASVFEGI